MSYIVRASYKCSELLIRMLLQLTVIAGLRKMHKCMQRESMIHDYAYDIDGLCPYLCTMNVSEYIFDTYSTVAMQQSLLSWSTGMLCRNSKCCCFRSKQVGHLSPRLGLEVGSTHRYAMQHFIFTVESKAWLWAVSRLYIYSHMLLAWML